MSDVLQYRNIDKVSYMDYENCMQIALSAFRSSDIYSTPKVDDESINKFFKFISKQLFKGKVFNKI